MQKPGLSSLKIDQGMDLDHKFGHLPSLGQTHITMETKKK
jgi:hypothetical protein